MLTYLKSDLFRTAGLTFVLLLFPLFVRPIPAPAGLITIAEWHFAPLNAALANRFYTQAMTALRDHQPELGKSWLVAAIQVDPQLFSPRYRQFIQERTQWLAQ